jgi:PAS domain-containing protein
MASVKLAKIFALVESIPLGAYVFQLEDFERADSLRVLYANGASERMIGVVPSLVTGTLIDEYFPNSTKDAKLAMSIRCPWP